MKRDIIYIAIIIGLGAAAWFYSQKNNSEEIKQLKIEIERLERIKEDVLAEAMETDKLVKIQSIKIKKQYGTIDSLKNIQREVPTINIIDIPFSDRDSAIIRLAAKP